MDAYEFNLPATTTRLPPSGKREGDNGTNSGEKAA
jgi:hypothetical protein